MTDTLDVAELYRTLQGESTRAGLPCAMVRLAGCNLRCRWCDTPYARLPGTGEPMTLSRIVDTVRALDCPRVEVTGGEPLLQDRCCELLERLVQERYEVLLETNGSVDIAPVPEPVRRIVDVKCPSSGHADAMRWTNVDLLTPRDELKFVLADRGDFDYACHAITEHSLLARCPVLLSPVWGTLEPAELAGWVLDSHLDLRLSLQLHKLLWPDRDQGV
jgi:7-carboxy-7-deazaguanine synthase